MGGVLSKAPLLCSLGKGDLQTALLFPPSTPHGMPTSHPCACLLSAKKMFNRAKGGHICGDTGAEELLKLPDPHGKQKVRARGPGSPCEGK